MKKILSVFMVVLMVLSMGVSVMAASDSFVESPTGRPAPGLIKFDPKDDDCDTQMIITPYGDKDKLTEDYKDLFEEAYKDITGVKDLTELNSNLKDLAEEMGIKGENLGVSDLFNIHTEGCENHDGHTKYDVVLEADALKNFVGLMYKDQNGKWVWVEGAKVTNNGTHLEFTVEGLVNSAPFAIIVDTSNAKTGDVNHINLYATIMVVSLLALGTILVVSKKRSV